MLHATDKKSNKNLQMKRILLLITILFSVFSSAQILEPVKWEFNSKKISDTEYELTFIANIDETWSIYSMTIDEGGPIATSIDFEEQKGYSLQGDLIEIDENRKTGHDVVFDMEVSKVYKKATYKQLINISSDKASVKGEVHFQACDHSKCLMPTDVPFEFEFKDGKLNLVGADTTEGVDLNENTKNNELLYGMQPEDIEAPESKVKEKNKSLWTIFGLGFLGGLIALLTPCVFPMIPLTVSFFTKQSKNKKEGIINSIVYGVSIIIIYVFLGTIITTIFGASALNELSTTVAFNVIFFLLLVFFAFSFFGYYELNLPSSWANKVDSQADRKGFIGIFFMALALAIVSFSCTGPVVGGLLVEAASKGGLAPIFGMLGFSLAIALPFSLFAMFPGWLNSLPKSGGWLNTTKVVLGFLELAFAFKFLSNADLVKHWGILKIEAFLVIWIIVFAGLALYLLGKIKFPHDSPIKKLSFFRVSTGILVAAFVVYLASGFRVNKETETYHSLKLLSGLAPPVGYSWLHPNDSPNNLESFKDLKEGIAYAQKINKPIMIDFTGYACVNCRKMEEHVWSEKIIDDLIRDEYVLISLYVDDKKELPENQRVSVNRINGGIWELESYGHKWSNFQTQFYKINSQPYYVLLTPDGKEVLNEPIGYTPDVDQYAEFLKEGVGIFKNKNKGSIFN